MLSRVAAWPAIANLAAQHRVGALFLRAVRSNRVEGLDTEVEEALGERCRRNAAHGMRQLDGMRRATAGLAAGGVPVLVLKGLPLGQRL